MDKPESLFDNRIIERRMARGMVSKEEYAAFLAGLEDDAEHAVETQTQFIRREPEAGEGDED